MPVSSTVRQFDNGKYINADGFVTDAYGRPLDSTIKVTATGVSPEGVTEADQGIFLYDSVATQLWLKATAGFGNTGWIQLISILFMCMFACFADAQGIAVRRDELAGLVATMNANHATTANSATTAITANSANAVQWGVADKSYNLGKIHNILAAAINDTANPVSILVIGDSYCNNYKDNFEGSNVS